MTDIRQIQQDVYNQEGIKQIVIKDNTYTIKLLPAYEAFAVATDLIKTFLPALGSYMDSSQREEYILPEENSMFAEMTMLLVTQMDKVNFVEIVQRLLNGLLVNGSPVDPNVHLRGKFSTMVAVTEFAMKENFSDFFTEYLKEKGLSIPSLSALKAKTAGTETTETESES